MSPLQTLDRVFRPSMQTGAGGQHSDMAAALAFLMKSGRQLSPEPKYIGPSAVLCRAQPSRASQSSGMWKIDPRNGIYERTEKKDRVARVAYGHGMSADNSRGGVNNSVGEGSRASKRNSRDPHVYSQSEIIANMIEYAFFNAFLKLSLRNSVFLRKYIFRYEIHLSRCHP